MDWYAHVKDCLLRDGKATARWVLANHPEDAKRIIHSADLIAKDQFVFDRRWDLEHTSTPVIFPDGIDWLFQPGEDPEFVYAFNRMEFWKTLGEAWLLTGDEQYPQAFARQLRSWVAQVPHDEAHAKAWRTIECGIRMEVWMKALKLMEGSKAMTGGLLELAFRSLREHARFIATVWDSYQLLSNWGIMANHGLFVTSVMLPPDEESGTWRTLALERLDQEIRIQVYDDGVHWEQSAMYHNEVLSQFLDVVSLSRCYRIPLPEGMEERIRKMARYSAAMEMPDGNAPSTGDSDLIDQRDLMERAAVLFQDSLLRGQGEQTVSSDAAWEIGVEGIESYDRLEPKESPNPLILFPDGGHAYWKGQGSYLHAKAGTLGAGHGHADQLAFDLYHDGENVLVDPGRYTYVAGKDRYWFKSAAAHNTVLVDGIDCYEAKDSWEYRRMSKTTGISAKEKEGCGYIRMGLAGYAELGVFITRKLFILDNDTFLVLDELYGSGEHTLESRLHFAPGGKLSATLHGACWESFRQKLYVASPNADGLGVEPGWVSPRYNEKLPSRRLVFTRHARCFSSLLVVLAFGHEPKVEQVPVTSNCKGTTFPDSMIEAWKVDGWLVVDSHREWGSPTDSFRADGHTGWGQCVIFGPEDHDIGKVMEY